MAWGLLALAAGCGGDGDDTAAGVPVVVATTSIWADVVANVACDGQVQVRTIVPVGADPHAFEPSLADRALMEDSVLIVANGLGLEEGLASTLEAVEGAGTPVFEMTDHIDTLPYTSHDDDDDDDATADDEHEHEGDDPHVWFDPVRVAAALPALADRLVAAGGLDPEHVAECVTAYTSELEAADAQIVDLLSAVPDERRKLVTNHDALGYFADRYGFEVVGTVIPTPSGLAETNPAQLEALARLIEDVGVPAVFAESQHSTADAEALAARVGDVEVVTLLTGTVGGDDEASTYVGFLMADARLIAAALSPA